MEAQDQANQPVVEDCPSEAVTEDSSAPPEDEPLSDLSEEESVFYGLTSGSGSDSGPLPKPDADAANISHKDGEAEASPGEESEAQPPVATRRTDWNRFENIEQMRDTSGNFLRPNTTYVIQRENTSWDVLEQGQKQSQVKFTNFGRHFHLSQSTWSPKNPKQIALYAPNIKRYLAGHVYGSSSVGYGKDSIMSKWSFEPQGTDSAGHRVYKVWTETGTVHDVGGTILPDKWLARIQLNSSELWHQPTRNGTDFNIKWVRRG